MLAFGPRKRKNSVTSKAKRASVVDSTRLHLTAIRHDRYAKDSYHSALYDFGDRYTASVDKQDNTLHIRDNVAHVSATVASIGKQYVAFGEGQKRGAADVPLFKKGYRLPNAEKAAGHHALLDDAALLKLVEDSQKSDAKAWEVARQAARDEYLGDIRYAVGFGTFGWAAVFVVATVITWASQAYL